MLGVETKNEPMGLVEGRSPMSTYVWPQKVFEPRLEAGATITCPYCGEPHRILDAIQGEEAPPKHYFKCSKNLLSVEVMQQTFTVDA